MSAPASELRSRNLRTLAVLAALFLLPLLLAFLLYYLTDWRPAGRVNHGVLLTPLRTLPALALPRITLSPTEERTPAAAFRGQWSLVYVGDGACDTRCRESLYLMRQTRLALNTDMTRIARVFLVSGDCCAREFLAHEHPGLLVLDASAPDAQALLSLFPAAAREQTLFIVDPLGNLVMSYDVRQDPHGLLADLRKLLRLSHIG